MPCDSRGDTFNFFETGELEAEADAEENSCDLFMVFVAVYLVMVVS